MEVRVNMSAPPAQELHASRRPLPDYLPARMINEYVYCPRLFYFEQVEGIFVHNEHTAEGAVQHKRVDREAQAAPRPDLPVRHRTLASPHADR